MSTHLIIHTTAPTTTDFSCGYVNQLTANAVSEVQNHTDAVSLIKQIQVKLGTCMYPQESYSLQTDGAVVQQILMIVSDVIRIIVS